MTPSPYDLLIVGGGINGCAIAREASLLGLSVLLVERDDLAAHTSSASTKLIHGGLRYLEYYEFKLVAEALRERERLVKAAPHIIHPMRFVLPQTNAVRPWWMVRLGLYLYDFLGGKMTLARSRGLRKTDTAYLAPLKGAATGFVYSDAFVDDARLTVLNAIDAAANGADVRVGTAVESARREDGLWQAALSDGSTVSAHAMVNAAGPWVHQMLGKLGVNAASGVRLVKGSHIVVPKLFEGTHSYILQQPDRRIVFAIPYQGEFTEIGTTDIPVDAPEDAKIDDAEIAYLCDAVNLHFSKQITPADVTSTWSGVRPLYDDGASEAKAVTRDYVLELDTNGPPLLSIFGGKITTARHLAEEAMEKLATPMGFTAHPVTRARVFPGGAIADFDTFLASVRATWPFLGDARAERMAHAYGAMLAELLADVTSADKLGPDLGGGLTEVEARWLYGREWARTPDDVLKRRSKLGLHLSDAAQARFAEHWDRLFSAAVQQGAL
ncbi:glycerol-3-phosphate dehydrogenase [Sphingomonas sp. 10B4]|uniref:glycerol-3-phosphate dehydrogenase n=1 Tax=Sphingomonas sp. 10B4 TaxID=3048575 RepID=UPI002AB5BFD3|nr:glycerol-3-phosphate dehydrogenase [Sphingomonas sp. 10B4]MDY7524987.1 glycerol-3-phosphate dehydrogenase [Sphingomonas sp. 10B4]MEB0281574.1 glycerol-3-phosphate dehydrogenase [Sphingomonas sp. 10B4]